MLTRNAFSDTSGPIGTPDDYAHGEDDVLRYKAYLHSAGPGWRLNQALRRIWSEAWLPPLDYPSFLSSPGERTKARVAALLN